jgi:DNA-binding transcriptional MocR family regulator
MWQPKLDRDQPAYAAIASAIREDIANGRLAPGRRLPTQRALARAMGLSLGTITHAYRTAEAMGLISCEVGRGSFVRGAERPADGELGAGGIVWPARRTDSVGLINLLRNSPVTAGAAERDTLLESMLAVMHGDGLSALLRDADDRYYTLGRTAAAKWLRRLGCQATEQQVLICAGAQHAVHTVFSTLLEPGDLVACEQLTYPGVKTLAAALRLRLRGLPMDHHGLSPEAFEAACREERVRMLYAVPTLHPATGALMPAARREAIAEIARRHDVIVVEDDDDSDLLGDAPPLLTQFCPERAVLIADIAKALAPGLRLAFLAAPREWVTALDRGIRATVLVVSPLHIAIVHAWQSGGQSRLITARRTEIAARQRLALPIVGRFAASGHPRAHHLWLALPPAWRGEEFATAAEQRGVQVACATPFVVPRGIAPRAIRVCLGPPNTHDELRHGLEVVAKLLESSPADPPGRL